MTPDERQQRLAELAGEIRTLAETDELTEEQEARWGEMVPEFETLTTEEEAHQARVKLAERAAQVPEYRIPGDGAVATEGPTLTTRTKRDPYDLSEMRTYGEDPKAINAELRSRARDAIEIAPEYVNDEWRETATQHLDSGFRPELTAAHYLRTGSEKYTEEFFRYMQDGHIGRELEETRAALSTTGANGGYLIPFFLDPSIILTNAGTINPWRGVCRVETIPTNVWHGVSSAGVTAEWTSEASEVTDASPTFSQPTVTPIRADAYVQASFEVTQDSNIANSIAMLFADAKARLESTAFAVGSGSTQPEGIVTRLGVTTASRVAANTNGAFGAIDVFALANALPPRWQQGATWAAHFSVANTIRQFATGTGPQFAFWADFGGGTPPGLIGYPFIKNAEMHNATLGTATASNDDILILGDFSQYLIVDRIGMEVVYNPLVIGTNRRPTGEVGWAAIWRVGADTTNADAFRMLRV